MDRQIGQILKKNFKLIFHSKTSYFLFFIIPLILFFIFGTLFINNSTYKIDLGLVIINSSTLVDSYHSAIEETGFNVVDLESGENCIKEIKKGILDLCVIFPEKFTNSSEKINVKIIVDNSNENLVPIAKTLLLNSLDRKTKEVKEDYIKSIVDLARELKKNHKSSSDIINKNVIKLNEFGDDLSSIIKNIEDSKDKSKGNKIRELAQKEVNNIQQYIDDNSQYKKKLESISDGLETNLNSSETEELQDEIKDLIKTFGVLEDKHKILYVSNSSLNPNKILVNNTGVENELGDILTKLNLISTKKNDINKDLASNKKYSENLSLILNNVKSTELNFLLEPVFFDIQNAYEIESNSSQVILPKLVAIITLIITLILSSAIIYNEKSSFAFKRNILSNISTGKFIFSNFLFLFILLFLQMAGIVLLFNIFFMQLWNISFLYFLIILIPIISLFILIGILFGIIVNSYIENLISIFFIIFIFLIFGGGFIPLEKLNVTILNLINILNPFIIVKNSLNIILLGDLSFNSFILLIFPFLIWIFILWTFVFLAQSFIMKRAVYHWFNKSFTDVQKSNFGTKKKKKKENVEESKFIKKIKGIKNKIEKKLKI